MIKKNKIVELVLGFVLIVTSFRADAVVELSLLTTPWIRLNHELNHARVDPKGQFIAFEDKDGKNLSILELKTKDIYLLTKQFVGGAFFWSPDGYRLFYREELLNKKKIHSRLKVYDTAINRSVIVDELPTLTSFLTFDPRDLRLQYLSLEGIRTKRIYFPGERLARWQVQQRIDQGKFLATQKGILWLTQSGLQMRRLNDDGSAIESFDISSDGRAIVWATKAKKVWVSEEGKTPYFIGWGCDPKWHPEKPLILYAGGRMVGNQVVNLDLRITDSKGAGKFLTSTQFSDERWPQWYYQGQKIIYTLKHSTDLYVLDFKL